MLDTDLIRQVKQSAELTGTIQIRHPYSGLRYRTVHRKPKFRKDGIYVQIGRGLYKIAGFKKVDMLDIYEVK